VVDWEESVVVDERGFGNLGGFAAGALDFWVGLGLVGGTVAGDAFAGEVFLWKDLDSDATQEVTLGLGETEEEESGRGGDGGVDTIFDGAEDGD